MPVRTRSQQLRHMAGDFLRETAVLVGVFAPLDLSMSDAGLTPQGVGAIVTVVAVSWSIGAYFGLDNE